MGGARRVHRLPLCACEMFEPSPPAPRQIEADAGDVVDDREIVVLTRTSAAALSLTRKSAQRGYFVGYREDLTGLDLILLVMIVPREYARRCGHPRTREP